MNQDNQVSNEEASANVTMKRKRGRPRKHPRQNLNHGENAVPRFQNVNLRENAHADAPPGFQGVNGNRLRPVDGNNNTNDVVVGQVVHGVIEAAFDAGYLLNVKVGNSETTLRGVVLKPGHYVPVSAHNDVAPNVQMVRRNEIPFPLDNHSQVPVSNSQSRGRRERLVNPYRSGASKGKEGASISIQTAPPVFSKNIYQPVSLSNGPPFTKQPSSVSRQAIHSEASKIKPVTEAVVPSSGSKSTDPVQKVGNQVFPLQAQISPQGMLSQPPSQVLLEAETKSMKLPGMPFEKLLTEVVKRIQPHSEEAQNGNRNDDANTDQALSIEPLQAVQPNVNGHLASLPKTFENFKTGKMTELLRAVQENMMDQASQYEEPAPVGSLTDDKLSPAAEVGDEENDNSKKHPQTSSV